MTELVDQNEAAQRTRSVIGIENHELAQAFRLATAMSFSPSCRQDSCDCVLTLTRCFRAVMLAPAHWLASSSRRSAPISPGSSCIHTSVASIWSVISSGCSAREEHRRRHRFHGGVSSDGVAGLCLVQQPVLGDNLLDDDAVGRTRSRGSDRRAGCVGCDRAAEAAGSHGAD